MAIGERDRRALLIGAIGLAAIGLYVFVVEPVIGAYTHLRTEHKVLASKVARVLIDAQKAKYLSEQVREWEENAGPLSPPQPYSEQITAVSGKIASSAQRSGVEVRNSSWTGTRPWSDDPALEVATVNIDAQGEWENVFKLIAELYRIEGVLSVEQMDLSGDPKGGKLSLRLTLSVFVKAGAKGRSPWSS